MQVDRRSFLKSAGGFALVSALESVPALSSLKTLVRDERGKSRIAVFFEPGFPEVQGLAVGEPVLREALAGMELAFLGTEELAKGLDPDAYDLFLNPYGSAFPRAAWDGVLTYLRSGGNWVNLGGIPFSVPVLKEGGTWLKVPTATEYHKKLGITSGFAVPAEGVFSFRPDEETDGAQDLPDEIKADEFYELYLCFTTTKDYGDEDGTGGQRDARVRALVTGKKGTQALPHVAPIVQIDRLQGECAGGRWVLANFKGTLRSRALRTLVELALRGPHGFTVRPSFACYRGAEMPSFTVQLVRPRGDAGEVVAGGCRLEVADGGGRKVASLSLRLSGTGSAALGRANLIGRGPLPPGLYRVTGEMRMRSGNTEYRVVHTTGFWMEDKKLLAGGASFTADSRYLLRDGKPSPVTGTTYMASDVHRKFLLEPNPSLWDRDFTQMKESGVTMVRTGIWTGWKNYMLDVGAPNEAALRAMDAFVLTARRHDIPVLFTFFAFLPEAWGGVNAYLDPRAVNAQKEFVTLFAERYREVKDILWDFINEPSFCSPAHLWSCRPNYDAYEAAAWKKWLQEHVADDASPALPPLEEFADANITAERHPDKVIEYRLFAQEMFERWVREMTGALRAAGGAHQLVTVGQDEGGTADRPNPQFFSEAVDFTSIHNWWYNDDLLWDSVITKTPARANLVEETGIMWYETMDGKPWRSEADAARLLERKMAVSLGAGGAGFLQWIWNTNPYMKSDNEAAIGFLRVDGTAKPELDAFMRVAKFFRSAADLLQGAREEDVVMVIPHSQMFSTRNFATEATKKCVRAMHYHCRIPMSAVSEYRLDKLPSLPKLLVVPSPRVLTARAWEALMTLLEKGATVLLTGLFDADEHWASAPERLKRFGLDITARPVAQEEFLLIGDVEHRLSYRGDKMQRIEKAVLPGGGTARVQTFSGGRGTLVWSPLPAEVSDSEEPIGALYELALQKAGIKPLFTLESPAPGILIRPTVYERAVLYTLVSECDRETTLSLTHAETATRFQATVAPGGTAVIILSRRDGSVISRLE